MKILFQVIMKLGKKKSKNDLNNDYDRNWADEF